MKKDRIQKASRSLILAMGVFVLSLLPLPHAVMAAHTDAGEMMHESVAESSVCQEGCTNPTPCFDHCLQRAAFHQKDVTAVSWNKVKVTPPPAPRQWVSFLIHKPLYRHVLRSRDPWGHRHFSTQARE